MSLYRQLQQRAADHRPIRIGMIGAGKFGSMYLVQIPRTPGVQLVGIAHPSPDMARTNLARVGWDDARTRVASLDAAIEDGTTHIGEDWRAFVSHPAIDVVVECTGHPTTAVDHCLDALGLAHDVRFVRPVAKGASLSWSDVAMDTTTRAYALRRELERLFGTREKRAA